MKSLSLVLCAVCIALSGSSVQAGAFVELLAQAGVDAAPGVPKAPAAPAASAASVNAKLSPELIAAMAAVKSGERLEVIIVVHAANPPDDPARFGNPALMQAYIDAAKALSDAAKKPLVAYLSAEKARWNDFGNLPMLSAALTEAQLRCVAALPQVKRVDTNSGTRRAR